MALKTTGFVYQRGFCAYNSLSLGSNSYPRIDYHREWVGLSSTRSKSGVLGSVAQCYINNRQCLGNIYRRSAGRGVHSKRVVCSRIHQHDEVHHWRARIIFKFPTLEAAPVSSTAEKPGIPIPVGSRVFREIGSTRSTTSLGKFARSRSQFSVTNFVVASRGSIS